MKELKTQQYRENAGVYRNATTSLSFDFISNESTFSETQNSSLESFDNMSSPSVSSDNKTVSSENIYDSIASFNSSFHLEQDGYLCPQANQTTRL